MRLVEKQKALHDDALMEGKLVKDSELGLSLPPHVLNHDANGFRNDSVPAQVSIVTVGDSQTWV